MNDEMKTYLKGMEQRIVERVDAGQADLGTSISALASHLDERFDELLPTLSKIEGHEQRIRFLEERLPKLATN